MKINANELPFKKEKESKEIKYSSFGVRINENIYYNKINYNQHKGVIQKLKNIDKYNFYFLLFIFISIYGNIFQSKKTNLRKLENTSDITIIIRGTGTQKILSDSYSSIPDTVLVNGDQYTSGKTVDLVEETNTITLKWDSEITDCKQMFLGLSNIINVDLTNFNALNVVDMNHMFSECTSLETIEINDFNTQYLTNMSFMFYGCSSLKSIDFKNINTQQVTDMNKMFHKCLQLTSIGLSSFNTVSVINFNFMFFNCIQLTSLNLSNFNTISAVHMNSMFEKCINLKYLNKIQF